MGKFSNKNNNANLSSLLKFCGSIEGYYKNKGKPEYEVLLKMREESRDIMHYFLKIHKFNSDRLKNMAANERNYIDYLFLAKSCVESVKFFAIKDPMVGYVFYNRALRSYEEALNLAGSEDKKIRKDINFRIAFCYKKIASIEKNPKSKEESLKKSIQYLEEAKKLGDEGPRIYNNLGEVYLNLAALKIDNYEDKGIEEIIIQSKENLEKSLQIKNKQYGFTYNSLENLSRLVLDNGMNPIDFGLMGPSDYLENLIDRYFKEKIWQTETIGKSKNTVLRLRDVWGLLNKKVFIKKGSFSDLEGELSKTFMLLDIIEQEYGNRDSYDILHLFEIYEHKDKDSKLSGFYLVSQTEKGKVLTELLEDSNVEKEPIFEQIIELLALIHTKAPIEGEVDSQGKLIIDYERGINDVKDRIQKLNTEGLNLENQEKFLESYKKIITECAKKSEIVFNKDAHPGNWIIKSTGAVYGKNPYTGEDVRGENDKIVVLDVEGGPAPMAHDLVKLLESGNYLSDKTKEKLLKGYIKHYNKFSDKTLNYKKLRKEYLTLLIHKAIIDTRTSSKDSPEDNNKVYSLFEKAEKAIQKLKSIYPKESEDYDNLFQGIISIEKFIYENYILP